VRAVFVDTWQFQALLDRHDPQHAKARQLHRSIPYPRVTTQLVLIELLNAFSDHRLLRLTAGETVTRLGMDRQMAVVPMSDGLFQRALKLYRERLDKDWSLTDCASFLTMRDLHLTDALTADHHFVQAGFRALLLD
jgi:predicted nucleic acid-binding protein